ncbi:hypothetical protein PE067_10500 [Paracoccus sp. DMF-8]|uniref:hypothetical protein n=1 Tax=Paracoccus sp. DMF-8 TaxID=3019445 RepID=UPI0023E8BBC3|nr:hypothetical protein [Paracoccus sp. DMF-8]MDF3606530.1 hypothetical protein [Paracoccus sp. DMF-8]
MAENLSSAKLDNGFDPKKTKAAIEKIMAAREKASTATGRSGAAVKALIEDHGLNKKAAGMITSVLKKDPDEVRATVGAFVLYAYAMGAFDQSDLFDDHIKIMRQVVDAVDDGKPGKGTFLKPAPIEDHAEVAH